MFHLMCGECGSYNVICRGNVLMEVDMRASTERWRIRSMNLVENLDNKRTSNLDII